jgi:hypothetical protein
MFKVCVHSIKDGLASVTLKPRCALAGLMRGALIPAAGNFEAQVWAALLLLPYRFLREITTGQGKEERGMTHSTGFDIAVGGFDPQGGWVVVWVGLPHSSAP